jgi:hypothetical protein
MTALRMTPPDISLSEIQKSDPKLAASGREFYSFMIELLADMYNDPCLYGMHPGVYEEFTNGRRYNAVKRFQPDKTRLFYDQASAELFSYLELLKETGIHCKMKDSNCVLSTKDFEYVKSYDNMAGRKKENAIPIETVIDMFARIGLRFDIDNGNSVAVINEKYPNMFIAMSALAKAADESVKKPVSSSLKYFFAINYNYLEFRQILRNYKPVYDDVVRSLSDDGRMIIEIIHKIAKEYKMRETYNYFGIEYQYKSKRVMTVWTDNLWLEPHGSQKQWIRNLNVRIWGFSHPDYQKKVEAYGEDFIKYFRQHLNYCVCCNPDHVVGRNGIRQVLGKNVRICSDPGGIIKNPTMEDLPYIRRYIDLKMEETLARS